MIQYFAAKIDELPNNAAKLVLISKRSGVDFFVDFRAINSPGNIKN